MLLLSRAKYATFKHRELYYLGRKFFNAVISVNRDPGVLAYERTSKNAAIRNISIFATNGCDIRGNVMISGGMWQMYDCAYKLFLAPSIDWQNQFSVINSLILNKSACFEVSFQTIIMGNLCESSLFKLNKGAKYSQLLRIEQIYHHKTYKQNAITSCQNNYTNHHKVLTDIQT
jgi:hypothetical protein